MLLLILGSRLQECYHSFIITLSRFSQAATPKSPNLSVSSVKSKVLLAITLLLLAFNAYLLVHLPITLANPSFLNLLYNNYIIHFNNCQVYLQTFFASKLTVEMETVACLFPPSKVWVITPHCPIILCITTQYRVSHRLLETHTLAHRVTVFYFLQKEYVLQATYLSQYYLQ